MKILLVGLAGAVGALSRYGIGTAIGVRTFPWATLGINLAGSYLLGVVLTAGTARDWPETTTVPLAVGFLGAFTTFSTFSVETFTLLRTDRAGTAAAYVTASLVGGVLAAAAGYATAQTANLATGTSPSGFGKDVPVIVVCGESLVDLVPADGRLDGAFLARPGGSPANVAVGLGRLGNHVALVTRLADDHFGRMVRAHLTASDVDLRWAARSADPTTLAVVNLDGHGRAEYAFYVNGAADGGWSPADLPPELPAGATLHVSGSLALGSAPMGDTLSALLEREHGHRPLSFDPNIRPPTDGDDRALRRRLDRWLELADLVKVSADDLAWLYPGEPVASVAERWLGLGPALVAVTLGRSGVVAVCPKGGRVAVQGHHIEVADTVGAGDAFTSGLLSSLERSGTLSRDGLSAMESPELTTALLYAQRVAAITCTRVGADPPWRSQLLDD